jgi:ankyrin repeat protein
MGSTNFVLDRMGATKDISSKSPLLGFPNELFLEVASHLESFADLNSLARTSRFFHTMFNTRLYRRAIAADGIVLDDIVTWVLVEYRLASLTLLLDNGLSVNHTRKFDNGGYRCEENMYGGYRCEKNMLFFLCTLDDQERSVPLARLLIQRGAHIDATDNEYSRTVLHKAVLHGNYPIVALLLTHGVDVNVADDDGLRALHFAGDHDMVVHDNAEMVHDNAEMVHLLIAHGADIEARSADGDTPLIVSSQYKQKHNITKALLKHGADAGVHNKRGATPLHCASMWLMSEHHELAESLLEHGADVNATDEGGRTPLHWLLGSESDDPLFMAKFLLDNGADVNAMSDEGSPLHTACWDLLCPAMCTRPQYQSGVDVVELLLEHGAIVNATDASRVTPLYRLLVSFSSNEFAIADLLLKNGADVNAVLDEGLSILQIAIKTESCADIIELLLLHGADVSVLGAAERCRMSQLSKYM